MFFRAALVELNKAPMFADCSFDIALNTFKLKYSKQLDASIAAALEVFTPVAMKSLTDDQRHEFILANLPTMYHGKPWADHFHCLATGVKSDATASEIDDMQLLAECITCELINRLELQWYIKKGNHFDTCRYW